MSDYHLRMERGQSVKIEEPVQPIVQEAQEVEQVVEQEEVVQEQVQQEAKPEPVQETQKEKDFRDLRAAKSRVERERDDAIRRAQEMEAKLAQQQNVPQEDDEIRLAPDDLAEGKHLSKVQREVKKLREEIQDYKRKSTESLLEARIKSQFPDFDSVVTRENIEILKESDPELSDMLRNSNDPYNQALVAYKWVKKNINPAPNYDQDKERAQRNASKPKPLASVSPQQGDSPLSKANAFANGTLSDDYRKQLWKEMNEARKSV